MSIFIGGCVALILGIIGIICWWWNFVAILKGVVPIMLIFAGALAVYLSYDQLKAWLETRKKEKEDDQTIDVEVSPAAASDVETLKKENEELKRKLEEQNQKIDEAIKAEPAAAKAETKAEEPAAEDKTKTETKTRTSAKDKETKDETK